MGRLRHAVVCASNVNRSMAAHERLSKAGLEVSSFGVGANVKLPGPTPDAPNRYAFDATTYQAILDDLRAKDEKLYTRNGLLAMMQRNAGVKPGPQRWQSRPQAAPPFDVVVTFERRVMEVLVEDMNRKAGEGMHATLVVNIDVVDSAADAAQAAPHALLLCQMLEEAEDWEGEIDAVLARFVEQTGRRRPQYDVCFS